MSKNGVSNASGDDPIRYAWIEAIQEDCIFIGTDGRIAGFRRRHLPSCWRDHFKAPQGNLTLAQAIDDHGSPAETPLELVIRLGWPLAEVPPRSGQVVNQETRGGHRSTVEKRLAEPGSCASWC
jgi:hypothetical protein